ncbi:Ig-like domain-containing protein [Chitinophaga barathri]|nr:Ig-like domain-containing protein [Chitinophaga barathri]
MNSTSAVGTVNIFPTLGTMKVYVNVGERVYLGSSAQGIGNGTIRVRLPNGTTFTTGSSTIVGRIVNRTQEINGPNVTTGVGLGYNAFIRTVAAGEAGVWEVDFVPPNVNSVTSPTPVLASAAWTQPSTTFVTAFDISVYRTNNTFATGRVFTNIFTANMGNYQYGFNGLFNVLTKDGYQYTVDNNGQTGFGFSFFANNKGARTAAGDPLYQSVNDLSNIDVQDPRAIDNGTDVTHKLFFNTPSTDLPASAPSVRGTEWLLTTSPAINISNIGFVGAEGSTRAGTNPLGGYVTFNAGIAANFAIDLDLNQNGVYTDAVDRRLTGSAVAGANRVYWDGKYGDGTNLPASAAGLSVNVKGQLFGGEVHFPFIDVENNVNGIIINRIGGGNDLVNWDDTPITVTGTPSNPRKATDQSSTTNGHKWGSTSYGSADFGDEVLLDTWAYVISAPQTLGTTVIFRQADLETVSITPGQAAYCIGQQASFAVRVKNNGPSAVDSVKFRFVYPAELTGVSVSSAATTGTSTVSGGTITGSQYDARLAMANGAEVTFTITGTVSAVPSSGTLPVTASMLRTIDFTDPDATNPDGNPPVDPLAECNAAPSGAGCNNIKTLAPVVSPLPTTANAGAPQTLCAATTVTLAGNTPATGAGVWTKVSGPGTQVITTPSSPGTTVTGLATGTYIFRWTISNGSCTASTSDVTITVLAALAGNTITAPAAATFCGSGDAAVITGSTPTGGTGTYTYQWQSSTDNTTFTNITGATSAGSDPPAATVTTYYRRLATSGACATASVSNVVTVTIQPAITNNTITAPATTVFCEVSDAAVIGGATPAGGTGTFTYQWQSSLDNSAWSDLAGSTAATYDPVRVGATVYYRRLVTSGACATASVSNVVTITVNPAITAGVVASSQSFCASGNPDAFTETTAPTGGTGTYTYQWQSSATSTSSGFTDIATATAATYDAPLLTQTTYYRRITRSGNCTEAIGNVLTVTVNPLLTAGTIGAGQTFCAGGDPAPFTQLTPATGGNGTYSYQWQSSTTSASAGFADMANATGVTFDAPAITQSTWYRRIVRSDNCPEVISNVVNVNVDPGLAGNTISADQSICSGSAPAGLAGTAPSGGNGTYIYLWESSTTGTGGFAPAPGTNNTANYTPAALTQSTIYRRTVSSDGCASLGSNIVQVSVTAAAPAASAGPDQGPLNTNAVTLAANVSGSGAGVWTETSAPSSGNIVNSTQPNTAVTGLVVPGTYIYRWTISNTPCPATFDEVNIIINAPPVAGNDNATTTEDNPVTITVLANDTDADGTITVSELIGPLANGTLVLNPDNTVTYTPRPDFFGTDMFTYLIRDNLNTASNTATVTVTVQPVNDVPVAGNDNINVAEDVTVNLPPPGILDNDRDADGGQLAASIISTTTNGTLTLNSDGSLQYTPRPDFTGTDQFTYRVCDATGLCDTATATFNVGNVNDTPVGNNDTYTITEDGVLNIAGPGVLTNDTDADGDALTANLVTGPAHGILVLQPNGSFRYVPEADYNGPDSFTYNACDASGSCEIATVTINVTGVNDFPLATNDFYNVNEDQPLTVTAPGLLFNDTDLDGNTLTATVVTPPANGTLTLNSDGSFTYTPNANFNGVELISYRVCDNGTPSLCDTATLSITVSPVNDRPVAGDDTYTTTEDTPLSATAPGVLANDTDIDSDAFTVSLITSPANGNVTLNANGSFVYTPNAQFNGADSYTYRICDASGGCDTATVNISVTAVNDRPVSLDESYTTAEDAVLTIPAPGLLINDRDADGDPLTASLVTGPASGTLTLNPNGSFTYTPAPDFTGTDIFSYSTCDNGTPSLCDTAFVTISVTPANDAPAAADDAYTLAEDTPLNVPARGVLTNDTDIDNDGLNASVVTGPQNGTVQLNADGSFIYTPNRDFNGTDSYTYRVCDISGACDTATVTLTITAVNDAPVAGPANYSGVEDSPLSVPAPGVLFNDTDPDGDPLTASLVTPPASGTLVLNADGSFVFTPAPDFNGTTSFTYRVCDPSGACDTTTAVITIDNVNDAPVAGNDAYTLAEDGTLNITPPGLLANDTDTDGNPLTASVITQPLHGTLTVGPQGDFIYTPVANYNGPDAFTYRVCDNQGGCDTGTVNITVSAVNDKPLAVNDEYNTTEDQPLTVAAPGPLFNDSDIDGNPLVAALVTAPVHGTVVFNVDGNFIYTPNANFNGVDSLIYQVCDGSNVCDTATVVINVAAGSDAPIAADDNFTTGEDLPLTIASPGLLGNDTDADGDQLSATIYRQPEQGTLTLNANGSFTYTPNPDYNGPDYFIYQVCDNSVPSLCDTGRVNLTVSAVNDAPRPVDDNYTVEEDKVLTVPATGILLNDVEPDGQAITAALVTAPVHGAVTLNANGSFTYTPDPNFNGIDSLSYSACDPGGNCANALVRIVVTPANDVPAPVADAYTLNEDEPLTLTAAQLLVNDLDPDGDQLQVSVSAQPANGRLTANGDGTFTYVPNLNFNGTDQFIYSACDPQGSCATAVVTLTVTAVNDTLMARDDEFKTPEDVPITIQFSRLTDNDTDVENEPFTVSLLPAMGPQTGTISAITADGFNYTPGQDVLTLDSFYYRICEPGGLCDTAKIYIRIDALNDAPVAVNDTYSLDEDGRLVIAGPGVLQNDTDADDAILTSNLLTGAANGVLTLNADGSFEYQPNLNFNGTDQFTYNVCDGTGACAPATVTITVNPVNDKPSAVNETFTTGEEAPLNGNVLTNDSDLDGDNFTAVMAMEPGFGTVVLNPDGTFTYTPNTDFNGTDVFTYRVCDNGTPQLCDTGTVIITVTEANDAPEVNNESYTLEEDSILNVPGQGVLGNDRDVDGQVVASVVTAPTRGTLEMNLDGSFRYRPNQHFNGVDSFTYNVCDASGLCVPAKTYLTITEVNDRPVAVDDTINLNEEQTVVLDPNNPAFILVNDSDPDGDPLTATPIGTLAHGTLTPNPDGTYNYTPDPDYSGSDFIYYQVCDNRGLCDTGFVTINLVNVNDSPVARADSFAINEDSPLSVPAVTGVLANDTDPDGEAIVSTLQTPANGRLTLRSNGSFEYIPNLNFSGEDTFTYQACDAGGLCSTAVVKIIIAPVNDPPVGVDDEFTRAEDTVITFPPSVALINDTDPDGNVLTGRPIGSLTKGSFTANPDGTYTYRPALNFNGVDSIEYQVCDPSGLCDTAIIRLTIVPRNDAPETHPATYSTPEDQPLVLPPPGILANDADADGDDISASILTPVKHGTVIVRPDGSLSYTPNKDFNGLDSLTYTACDLSGTCDTNVIYINVSAVNDPPVAVGLNFVMNEDAVLNTAAPGALLNDTDPDGDALAATLVTPPANGTLTLNADGSFTYEPNDNFNGQDQFTYRACDGQYCDEATVFIDVLPAADAPLAVNDTVALTEDSLFVSAAGVLANDVNTDGSPLNITVVTPPIKGQLALNGSGGIQYRPNLNANGADSAVYRICDAANNCSDAKIYFNIAAVNDRPVGVDDYFTRTEDTVITFSPAVALINDADPDGDVLTGEPIGFLTKGTFVRNPDGTYTYRPLRNFHGVDSIAYRLCDPSGLCDTAVIHVTLLPVNDKPLAVDDAHTTNEDQALSVLSPGMLVNDSDVDVDDVLNASVLNGPYHGSLIINRDNSFTYQPSPDYFGLDSFTYIIADPGGLRDTAVAMITINSMNDAPVALDDAYFLKEGETVNGNLLVNDNDPDSNAISALVVQAPANGSLGLNPDGTFTYTPNAGFSGTDSALYSICDNGTPSLCDSARVSFIVAENMKPLAVDDAYTVAEDVPLNVAAPAMLANDSDPEGRPLTVAVERQPAHGVFTLQAGNAFGYVPASDFFGLDTVVYVVTDAGGLKDTALIVINVSAVNDPPMAAADTAMANENTPVSDNVLTNDTDIEGDRLTASLVTAPVNGTVVLNADGSFTYTPNTGYVGLDSLIYQVCDNGTPSFCDTATLILTTLAVNSKPVATDDAYTISEDGVLNISAPGLAGNDSDTNGDTLTLAILTPARNGVLTLGLDSSFSYTPASDFFGMDTAYYTITDGGGLMDTAMVVFTVTAVNDSPVAAADSVTTDEGTPVSGNVLTNDTDIEGNGLTASLVTAPVNGTVVLNADGSFTYTPSAGYNGLDSLIYQVCDNGTPSLCDTATLYMTTAAVNEKPIAVNDAYTIPEDGTLNVPAPGLFGNDSDPDGDTLTARILTPARNGVLTLGLDSSFSYVPAPGFFGNDTAYYIITDGSGLMDTAMIVFTVTAVNDSPVAVADSVTTDEDTPVSGNVQVNDTDVDSDTLRVSLVTAPVNGTVVLNADGSFTYTPDAGFNGLDSLIYQLCDNATPSLCDTATLYMTTAAVNEKPIAVNDAYTVPEDGTLNVPAPGLFGNDSDPDGDTLTARILTPASNGVLTLGLDSTFSYVPAPDFFGNDTAYYIITDGSGLSDTAMIVFTVTAVNDSPVAATDSVATDEGTLVSGNVLTNDTDIEGNSLTASLVTAPVNGTVVLNADGSFTYTPSAGYNGLDSLIYQVCDNGTPSRCDTATLYMTTAAVNEKPISVNDVYTVSEDGTLNVPAPGLFGNDSDPDGNTLTARILTPARNGVLTLGLDSTFSYVPAPGFFGNDTAYYIITDPGGLSDTAMIVFTVTSVNDAPVATDDAFTSTDNVPATGNLLTNDSDPDGDTFIASVVTVPANGTFILNPDGSFTYTPANGFSGTDSATYRICDSGTPSRCDTAKVRFTVTIGNIKPVAVDDTVTVTSGATVTHEALRNDRDDNGNTLTASIIRQPQHGTLGFTPAGKVTYTADADYTGADTIIYRLCDDGTPPLCDTGYIYISITAAPENPAAGLAKAADAPVLQPDGSYLQTFVFTLRNTGNADMKNVMTGDDLRGVFPSPVTYTVENITASGTLIANTAYNGTGDTALLQNLSTLDVGRQDSITLTLRVNANGSFGPFTNSATLQAQSIRDNIPVTDASNEGRDPATAGSRATSFSFAANPRIGLAKAVSDTKLEINGSYTFTYTFFLRNMGNTALTQIRLSDNLQAVFPTPLSFRVVGDILASGNLTPNPGFNGTTDQQLLISGSSRLDPGRQDTIRIVVNVLPNKTFGTYNNMANVLARIDGTNNDISDASMNGNLTDPDGNGIPDEQAATPVVLNPTQLRIPQGFSPNGDGVNDRFVIGNVGNDKINLEVYNRWGNVVFKSSEYRNDWDGTCNLGLHIGQNLPDGTYYYVVVNITTGEKYVNFITIMR